MADRRGIIVPLLILAFIFLSPEPNRPAARQIATGLTLDDVIADEQRSLTELHDSTYAEQGIAALNLTGFEAERGYAWDAIPQVRDRAQAYLEYSLGEASEDALQLLPLQSPPSLYKNVTGFVHGDWVRSSIQADLPASHVNLSHYATFGPFGPVPVRQFGRNITGEKGAVRIRLHNRFLSPSASLSSDVLANVTKLDAELTISDDSAEHNLRVRGVYFLGTGQAVLTTTSDKLAGIFLLPHLTLSKPMFEASRALLNESISMTIERQIDGQIESFNPWTSNLEGAPEARTAAPECELIIYLQQLSPTLLMQANIESSVLALLEQELRYPTGAFVPPAPEMKFSMLIFSPDCGFVLESKGPPDYSPQDTTHLVGPKAEKLSNTSRSHVLAFTAVLLLQLFLLKRQMREASTPSTQSRISLFTLAIMSLGDGFTFMTFLLISYFSGGLWVTVMATAFVSFVCVSFFGMRFLLDVWTVQAPERERRRREEAEEDRRRDEMLQSALQRLRAAREARIAHDNQLTGNNGTPMAPVGDDNIAAARDQAQAVAAPPLDTSTAAPPANVTNPSPIPNRIPASSQPAPIMPQPATGPNAIPTFMPSDQAGLEPIEQPAAPAQQTPITLSRESFGAVYTRFYLLLLGILFLSLNAAAWPAEIRRVYFTFLGFAYLSFWLPQISRNVQRNCRKAFSWEFVVGQSVSRLMPFVYLYSYPGNIIFAEADYISLAILGLWMWVQLLLLVSQEIVGPRWFVGKDWAPPAYDYHPVLREDEEGNTMPIGFSQATASSPTTSKSSSDFPLLGRERSNSSRRGSITAPDAKAKGKRVYDCAICMQELEVPVIENGGSGDSLTGPASLLARRMYMVTPCRHIFHSACLEGWMKYRLQCPICRETLPPL